MLVSEMIERSNFSGIVEAMEKSIAEGSQTFEQDIARLIAAGVVDRKEGLLNSDSPTNLMWRLQNDLSTHASAVAQGSLQVPDDQPTFTEITLDVPPT